MSADIFWAQLPPPTPTALPPAAPIELPALQNAITTWKFAPEVVGFWNQFRDYTPGFQTMLIVLLVIGLIFLIMNLIRRLGETGTGEKDSAS